MVYSNGDEGDLARKRCEVLYINKFYAPSIKDKLIMKMAEIATDIKLEPIDNLSLMKIQV